MNHKGNILDDKCAIDKLLQRADLWQASTKVEKCPGIPTGYQHLDNQLHSTGWPTGAITELLADRQGIGEMRLLIPALAQLSHQQQWLAFIAPPHIPYAPALAERGIDTSHILLVHPKNQKDQLWATEQALRSNTCCAVLTWLPHEIDKNQKINTTDLRRLQLAAQQGNCLGVLFRPTVAAQHASPSALRIKLSHGSHPVFGNSHLRLNILKQRGGWSGQTLQLTLEDHLQQPRLTVHDLPIHQVVHKPRPAAKHAQTEIAANEYAVTSLQ